MGQIVPAVLLLSSILSTLGEASTPSASSRNSTAGLSSLIAGAPDALQARDFKIKASFSKKLGRTLTGLATKVDIEGKVAPIWLIQALLQYSGGLWDFSAPLKTARQDFKAVLLPSGPLRGQVLAVGGCCNGHGSLSGSELFNPETSTWQKTGDLQNGRWLFQAVALSNGSALAVGGLGVASGGVLNSTELFIPAKNGSRPFGSWQKAADMNMPRQDFEVVLLEDGRVLAAGGFMASAEIFDPVKNKWTKTQSMKEARSSFQGVLLRSNQVLVMGGRGRQSGALASSELYDPSTKLWKSQGNMTQGRAYFAAASLPDGRVAVAGGKDATGQNLNSSEIYDPKTGKWSKLEDMAYQRSDLQAATLPDGKVLVVGGLGGKSSQEIAILDTAEVLDPVTGRWSLTKPMTDARYVFQLVPMANSSVMALGGTSMSGYTASTEIFGVA